MLGTLLREMGLPRRKFPSSVRENAAPGSSDCTQTQCTCEVRRCRGRVTGYRCKGRGRGTGCRGRGTGYRYKGRGQGKLPASSPQAPGRPHPTSPHPTSSHPHLTLTSPSPHPPHPRSPSSPHPTRPAGNKKARRRGRAWRGAEYEVRTRDLRLGKPTLDQLS